jgi:hypothetical protein
MHLADLTNVLIALEPHELGLRMLPMLAQWDYSGGNTMEVRRFLGDA